MKTKFSLKYLLNATIGITCIMSPYEINKDALTPYIADITNADVIQDNELKNYKFNNKTLVIKINGILTNTKFYDILDFYNKYNLSVIIIFTEYNTHSMSLNVLSRFTNKDIVYKSTNIFRLLEEKEKLNLVKKIKHFFGFYTKYNYIMKPLKTKNFKRTTILKFFVSNYKKTIQII